MFHGIASGNGTQAGHTSTGERRPHYQTEKNSAEERRIAAGLANLWDCQWKKLPDHYSLDYAFMRYNRVTAWAEIKQRFVPFDHYPCIYLALNKVFAARRFHGFDSKPCLFIVEFDDCLAYADMLPLREIGWGGRWDRDPPDPQDNEPMALVWMDEFTIIDIRQRSF